MIPLGRWLKDEEDRATGYDAGETVTQVATEASDVCNASAEVNTDHATLEREELEQRLEDLHRQIEDLRKAAAAREQEFIEQLGRAQATLITSDVLSVISRLQGAIEGTLLEVLTPFLGQVASRRATDELVALIHRSMKESPEPLLVLRAPQAIHSHLQPLVEENLGITLAESEEIELVFASYSARFEDLTGRWLEVLRDPAR